MLKHGENMQWVDASAAREELLQGSGIKPRHQGTIKLRSQFLPLES